MSAIRVARVEHNLFCAGRVVSGSLMAFSVSFPVRVSIQPARRRPRRKAIGRASIQYHIYIPRASNSQVTKFNFYPGSDVSASSRSMVHQSHRLVPLCTWQILAGDCRGCAEPEEPMSAMQLRLPKGRAGKPLEALQQVRYVDVFAFSSPTLILEASTPHSGHDQDAFAQVCSALLVGHCSNKP